MNKVYQERKSRHFDKMMKYMKYVFNDHMMIVLFFIIGGLGLYYSNLLKTIHPPVLWPMILWVVIATLSLSIGGVATLMVEADKVFLLPKETHLKQYFKQSLAHSLWLPAAVLASVTGVMMPLLVLTHHFRFSHFLPLCLILWLLKGGELSLRIQRFYQGVQPMISWIYYGLSVIILGISCINPYLAVPLAMGMIGLSLQKLNQTMDTALLDWDQVIESETQRMLRIYRFINLFTDVPEVKVSIHRRAFLDGVIHWMEGKQRCPYRYLYTRHFIRSDEYSGLFLRLTLIASIILLFNSSYYLNLMIAMLFFYLVVFQLVPIYKQFDAVLATHLYPIANIQKKQALKHLLLQLESTMSIIFSITASIGGHHFLQGITIFIVLVLEGWLFNHLLLERQIKKYEL